MVVVALNGGLGVLETDVVKPGKRRSVNVSDAVIRDKKQLLCREVGEGGRVDSGQCLQIDTSSSLYLEQNFRRTFGTKKSICVCVCVCVCGSLTSFPGYLK